MTFVDYQNLVATHNSDYSLVPVVRAEGGPSLTPLIATRRSPRALGGAAIAPAVVERLLQAARWASSSMNAQPWSFIVVRREDAATHAQAVGVLMPGNVLWASKAPLMIVAVARVSVEGKTSHTALYDLGLAVSQLVTQATSEGLAAHQMGGFDRAKAREVFALPEGWEPVVMIAIGEVGSPENLPDSLRAGETAPRTRKPLAEIAFGGRFGVALVKKS